MGEFNDDVSTMSRMNNDSTKHGNSTNKKQEDSNF